MIGYTFTIHMPSGWSPLAAQAKTNNRVLSPGSNKRKKARKFARTRGRRL